VINGPRHDGVEEDTGIAPLILNIGTGWVSRGINTIKLIKCVESTMKFKIEIKTVM
jgi:hypothetical protein